MKIAILGLGYVGLTAVGCLTAQGHHVLGVDVSPVKVAQLREGRCPISEPGLDDLIADARAKGLIEVSTTLEGGLDDRDLAIVCVGTPSAPDGSHDMSYIAQVTREIAQTVKRDRPAPLTVAYRSTIRPGTIESLILPIFAEVLGEAAPGAVEVVYNPEFLRESLAVKDFFAPPKIVVGTADGLPCANMTKMNEGISAPVFHTRYREAEFTKFADNTFHAVKVAFANELGRICQLAGVDPRVMHRIFVSDTKLNISPYYLRPGGAFGGSCLPKDVRALAHIAADVGAQARLISSLMDSNEAHKRYLFEHCTRGLDPGARILMVGLAFKADTDDLRESPNVDLANRILEAGFDLTIFDPTLDPQTLVGRNLTYASSHLPDLARLLAEREAVEAAGFERVIDTNGRAGDLALGEAQVIDINALA
jgi:GDP-mannose 6-dehydrogenase